MTMYLVVRKNLFIDWPTSAWSGIEIALKVIQEYIISKVVLQ